MYFPDDKAIHIHLPTSTFQLFQLLNISGIKVHHDMSEWENSHTTVDILAISGELRQKDVFRDSQYHDEAVIFKKYWTFSIWYHKSTVLTIVYHKNCVWVVAK